MSTILEELIDEMELYEGAVVQIASDMTKFAYLYYMQEKKPLDINEMLDIIINRIGTEGTLILPTYNWDFCKGIPFDYYNTPCKTGALSAAALKRKDFVRTHHPIYSYAVWGKDADKLYHFNNVTSFGKDSVLGYLHEKNAYNILIGIDYNKGFTFGHYVEEQVGVIYRYQKNFTAPYTDEFGNTEERTYQMYVRDLDMDVVSGTRTQLLGRDFEQAGLAKAKLIQDKIPLYMTHLGDIYSIVEHDIRYNKSRKFCEYRGQNDE